jgi:uncharacterized protein
MKIEPVDKYIQDCLRLLYWMCFKPYTFAKWLQGIHPQLQAYINPFSLRAEFGKNYRLQRYANQVILIKTITPILLVIIVAPIYSICAGSQFNWLSSGQYLLAWLTGIWLAYRESDKSISLSKTILIIYMGIILFLIASPFILPTQIKLLLQNTLFGLLPISLILSLLQMMVVGYFAFLMTRDVKTDVFSDLGLGIAWIIGGGMQSIAFIVMYCLGFGVPASIIEFDGDAVMNKGVLRGLFFSAIGAIVSGLLIVWLGDGKQDIVVGIVTGSIPGLVYTLAILRFYFWVPELIWMLILELLVSPSRAVSVLRRLPPYFDQVIILPLPFMAEIIIQAHRQNPVAARSTIDYFITSTNQQTVAKKAMFGIGVNTLSQCSYPSDIVGAATQLDWLPTDEKTFGTVFPRLLEISHDIGAAYQATSPYRQLELVDRSILDLQKLQTSLSTAASASDAPQFGTITTRWLQILNDNRQALETAAQQSAEIPNPYLAGSSLEPADAKERFKGRQDLFRAIEDISLSAQPPVLLLYGRRRTGKTSTLKYLPSRVSSDLIPLLVDFQGAASIQRMENIAEFIATAIVKTAKSARNLNLPTLSPAQLSNDPFYALQTWMEQIERDAPGRRFLLCIDEFERLEEVIATSGSRAPLNFLRYVMQNRRQWIVLFSGSHRLDELQPYWSDYLIGTRTLPITYLQPAEARELVQHPVPNFPDIYAPAAVDEILRLTRGQPYLVQLLCSCVVEYINSADVQRQLVTVADVDAAKPIAWERGIAYFQEFWVDLKTEKQDFLTRLLAQSSIQESDRTLIKQLIQSEVIEADALGEYQFQVPLIEQYLQQKDR